MYLSACGAQLFGGAVGSSYHDVIVAAGLTDAAAAKYHDWPNYSVEDVLALDPDFVLASNGMNETLCRQPGFEALRACRDRSRILMLPDALVGDPGPRMLDAAEALRAGLEAYRATHPR